MPEEPNEAIDRFRTAVEQVVEYHTREYNMTYEEMIGCFEMLKMSLWEDYKDSIREDCEEDEDEV